MTQKKILTQKFFGPEKIFWPENFFDPKIFWPKNCFDPNIFFDIIVVNDIGASQETEEIINCIYGLKKSKSNEIESDKVSIVAKKPSDVRNDSDPYELEPD